MDGLIIPKITKAKKAIKLKVVTQSLSFTLTLSLSHAYFISDLLNQSHSLVYFLF